jgi:hypothetical protein
MALFRISLPGNDSVLLCCGGISDEERRLRRSVGEPKSPDSNGSKIDGAAISTSGDSLDSALNAAMPSKPQAIKIAAAQNIALILSRIPGKGPEPRFDSITSAEIMINITPMLACSGSLSALKKNDRGAIKRSEIPIASPLPMAERRIASTPLPSSSIRWPGSTAITVASSGAPRKMDGTTSRKLWEIVLAIIIMATYSEGTPEATSAGVSPRSIADVLFTWTPGSSPAMAPTTIPARTDRANSESSSTSTTYFQNIKN